ncbi:MAG: 4-(cytidine 5'-diphospho)-2-C-methyl-D-erythritol kinase [Xanthomonadales bacterium]|nr:4-(cytidine 5'-diphospho)-2-C-methyl-D-erythritol kinase [Xanthomonadales bacterium]
MARSTERRAAWPAPAKINLFLHITGRRPDGYHELQTLFQLLDWGDEIRVQATADPVIRRDAADYSVAEDADLAVRAARLLQTESACRRGARIRVLKRIPLGAGLGGGSSDAATVLLVLNRLWNCGLTLPELAGLGARLGADVPVFVNGRSAMATGIGERLQPVNIGRRHYVLVLPGLAISTAAIFADPELARDSTPISLADALAGRGRNDCEAVVRKRYPQMAAIMASLEHWGRPVMTGTGSAIFLPMESRERAIHATREMKTLYNVRAVTGLDCSPVHEMLDADGP